MKKGFTLIELSIVLVIIGLVVGGVLVGKDLIKAAEIRAQISQIDRYTTSVRTFQSKYAGLPGDLLFSTAAQLGFYSSNMDGTAGHGDGNGLIENEYGSQGFVVGAGQEFLNGEVYVFWRDLSDAKMIDGTFGQGLLGVGGGCMHNATLPAGCLPSNQNTSQVNLWIPAAKIRPTANIIVYSVNGANYYQIVMLSTQTSGAALNAGGSYNGVSPMTPLEASDMDKKVDDGMPNSGKVVASEGNQMSYPVAYPSQAASHCLVFSTPAVYDTGSTYGNKLNCSLSLQF